LTNDRSNAISAALHSHIGRIYVAIENNISETNAIKNRRRTNINPKAGYQWLRMQFQRVAIMRNSRTTSVQTWLNKSSTMVLKREAQKGYLHAM
jgi:hypothetical protein